MMRGQLVGLARVWQTGTRTIYFSKFSYNVLQKKKNLQFKRGRMVSSRRDSQVNSLSQINLLLLGPPPFLRGGKVVGVYMYTSYRVLEKKEKELNKKAWER